MDFSQLQLDTILSVLGPVGTLVVVLAWLFKELVLDRNRETPISREERDLLIEIRSDVKHLKGDFQEVREQQETQQRRLDDHLEHHAAVGRNSK